MDKYTIYVYVKDESTILIDVEPETDYELKKNITSIGVNGITSLIESDIIYYPPHRIIKIEAKVKNN